MPRANGPATPTATTASPERYASESPIDPTVGRVVLYRNDPNGHQYPALISRVWGRNCINLTFFPDDRPDKAEVVTSVVFDENPATGRAWSWMPFQKGQAQRTDNAETKLKQAIGCLAKHSDGDTQAQIAELLN